MRLKITAEKLNVPRDIYHVGFYVRQADSTEWIMALHETVEAKTETEDAIEVIALWARRFAADKIIRAEIIV